MIKIKKIIGMFEKIVFKRSVKTQKKKKRSIIGLTLWSGSKACEVGEN